MIHIQSFKDKIEEYEKTKKDEERLKKELYTEAEEIKNTIVEILDEVSERTTMTINVNITSNFKYTKHIYKIEHSYPVMKDQRDLNLHSQGINTKILWKEVKGNNSDILWNFLAGGKYYYEELSAILEFLITKYPKQYNNVLRKKDQSKYNL